tara:strand:+ start:13378 stop:13773 length:396 start_codon:yes stop_codon:yes gene_type:complete
MNNPPILYSIQEVSEHGSSMYGSPIVLRKSLSLSRHRTIEPSVMALYRVHSLNGTNAFSGMNSPLFSLNGSFKGSCDRSLNGSLHGKFNNSFKKIPLSDIDEDNQNISEEEKIKEGCNICKWLLSLIIRKK